MSSYHEENKEDYEYNCQSQPNGGASLVLDSKVKFISEIQEGYTFLMICFTSLKMSFNDWLTYFMEYHFAGSH